MEDVAGNANNDESEQEESTGSVPSPLFSDKTMLKKRLRSKVWDDFTPTFVDRKLAGAQCMHCRRTFNCPGTNGTTSLWNHLKGCSAATQKRPKLEEHTLLPSTQKGTTIDGSKLTHERLPFLPSGQTEFAGTADVMPMQEFVPDIRVEKNGKNQEVDQNGCNEEHAEPEPCRNASSEQDITNDTSQKDQKVDQKGSLEELVRMLAIHGYLPRMMEQDGFREVFACINPTFKMPSHCDLIETTKALFQLEKSKLKEKLAALRNRVCLSAYIWHHDPHSAFLCLSVHYIDEEWENQQKIIKFSPLNSSCGAKELSDIILGAIKEWDLDGKIFSIILDDAFVDDSVGSDVKASLQKSNKLAASRSLFVVRYASHLLDQVAQVALDELEKTKDKTAKFSKYSKLQHPNCGNAPSPKDWERAGNLCEILEDFYMHIELMPRFCSPASLLDSLKDAFHKVDLYSRIYKRDEAFSNVLDKMKQKFKERWNFCFLHICMPMAMDPRYSLKHLKHHVPDNYKDEYICIVRDTFLSLFNEYSDQVDEPNCSFGSKTSNGNVLDEDTLSKYFQDSRSQIFERPMTELCQYLQEKYPATREHSVLPWWKEHCLSYPTIARMARDILALPSSTDCKVATKTARIAMAESGHTDLIEELVCTQDWLKPAGTTSEESMDDL